MKAGQDHLERVALNVIKLGMDSKAVMARFEAERPALAWLDPPNIAKGLEAGSADGGMSKGRNSRFQEVRRQLEVRSPQ